ncbi:MAG: photosynthetic reaction center cytochrome c subunit family protein, partial [Blastocatellia bacterium]
MNKEFATVGVVGIIAGLVLGFLVANWTSSPSTAQTGANQGAGSASVNGPNTEELPPGHPPINGQTAAQSGPAGQLPPGHPDVNSGSPIPAGPLPGGGDSSATAPSAQQAQFPSLDPLPAGSKDVRAEQKYKNIQVLKGVGADQWMSIMFAFKQSLGVDCTYCHVKDKWDSDEKPEKQTARKMIKMVKDLNGPQYVGGMG